MTTVAILGAGAGGLAATVEFIAKGYKVRLWNRSIAALTPISKSGGLKFEGVFGSGQVSPELISQDIQEVIDSVEVILVCVPTIAHRKIAEMLASVGANATPVVLNPGHTGGALEFRSAYEDAGARMPPLAELSTLTYVARKTSPDTVCISGVAEQVRVAGIGADDAAIDIAQLLYPSAVRVPDVIATGLSNVNLVLHPPGSVLGAAWIEATKGDFTFYVEGLTGAVSQTMQKLDSERRKVAGAYGHDLPALVDEMALIGTVERSDNTMSFGDHIRSGEANRSIRAPDSLEHRYFIEDFWYGLMPFLALANCAEVDVPVARALMNIAIAMREPGNCPAGRSAAQMGIEGFSKNQIISLVSESK